MIEEMDRLPDWAFTDEELDNMARDLLTSRKLDGSKHLAIYHLYKDGNNTGVVMILAVDSISDGLHAINRLWGIHDMYAEFGEFTEEDSPTAGYRLRSIEEVLEKFRYEGKIRCPGSDKLYRYQNWFPQLL